MIRKKKQQPRDNGRGGTVISIIGPGVEVKGDLVSPGSIRVEGEVEGTVYAAKGVVVGQHGGISGDISTQDAVIAGRVDGSLHAASRVEVHASARITGEVHSRSVQVEEGAQLNGQVRMDETLTLEEHPGLGLGEAKAVESGEEERAMGLETVAAGA